MGDAPVADPRANAAIAAQVGFSSVSFPYLFLFMSFLFAIVCNCAWMDGWMEG